MLQPMLVLGTVEMAGDLVLRRLCKAKSKEQALIVMDYTGLLASRLSRINTAGLAAQSSLWLDLAHKVRPVSIFRFRQGQHLQALLVAWLRRCAQEGQASLSQACLQAVAQLASQLCSAGTVGLVALATSLRRPELTAAFRQDVAIAAELDAAASLLEWMLRFPAVWALSESNNTLDLAAAVRSGKVLWISMPHAYMQPCERRLVGWMAELAIAQAVLGLQNEGAPALQMLSVLPPSLPLGVEVRAPMRQIVLLNLDPSRALHNVAATWLANKADVWVVGPVNTKLSMDKHTWLPADQCARVEQLQAGQVWVISGKNQTGVTALTKYTPIEHSVAHSWQRLTLGRLSASPARQFGWSPTLSVLSDAHQGLYEKLATHEILLAGWMRVRTAQKYSHGIDRVTVDQFGTELDSALLQLVDELREMRYVARPLRTIRLPKPDGDTRLIKVACVRDRVVQAAFLHLVEPLFDTRMNPRSFAYRPGRSAHHALALARSAIHAGKHWAVVADIKKMF